MNIGGDGFLFGRRLAICHAGAPSAPQNRVRHCNGTFTYTPTANFNGTDSFTYTLNDGAGGSNTATVTVTVNPVNDAPVAGNNAAAGNEDTAITTGNVLANDSDVDNTLTAASITAFSQGAHGTVVNNGNGTFTYTPYANFNGTDSFTYTLNDGAGGSNTANITITVYPVDDPAVAQDDAVATTESAAILTGSLFADDGSGVDRDPDSAFSVTAVAGGPQISLLSSGGNVGRQITLPSGALLTVNPDGTYSYDPNHLFDYLPAAGSGASVLTVTDTFSQRHWRRCRDRDGDDQRRR